ncbi:hypothetical protein [Metabacillus fastidiosus]|uniref:Uncharacterized protein n=1 Tax=Metabacillus fastidiosus TaxID=1458 RepID=A0ABU6NRL3_9BACI|nr:hypothetical protein [Metabacillus fastidiosus]
MGDTAALCRGCSRATTEIYPGYLCEDCCKKLSQPNMNFENSPLTPQNEFEQAIIDVCKDIAETLIKKNRDYGDSYRKMKEEFGDMALIIRQEDKLNRLKSLLKKENLVNESTTDTKKDGAGYYLLDLACERVSR